MLELLIGSFAIGFGVAIIFGMPLWLIVLLGICLVALIIWYNANVRWHNQRTVSGEGLEDDLDEAGAKYLTAREGWDNYRDARRLRPRRHQPRNEVGRLYDRDHDHD